MTDILNQSRQWNQPKAALAPAGPNIPFRPWILIAGACATLIVVLALLGFVLRPASCQTYQKETGLISGFIEQGKTDTAYALAEAYLASNPCQDSETALGRLSYQAGMQELYKHPELGLQAVERWKELEGYADKRRVPKSERSPMTVFANSYNSGMWDLAQASFIAGWEQRLVGPQDRQSVAKYYATLFNLSYTLLEKGDQKDRERALQAMATAAAISKTYAMVQAEARSYLQTTFGQNEALWPNPDKDDPILTKTQGGKK